MSTRLAKKQAQKASLPNAKHFTFGIVVAEWNKDITSVLLDGALTVLKKAHCPESQIFVRWVPGTMELPLAAQWMFENLNVDAVIALGCVIRGDTPHFDYVCLGATNGLMDVQLDFSSPITFGILTVNTLEQAKERADGSLGNKGSEAAEAAIKMIALDNDLSFVNSVMEGDCNYDSYITQEDDIFN